MFLKKISLCAMTLLFAAVSVNAQSNTSSNMGSLVEVHKFDDITTNIYRYPFASLDWTDPSGGLALSGTQAKRNVRFEIKKDELVTGGTLELYYTPSPALIPVRSHLNVYFNGLLIKSLPILKEHLGNKTFAKIAIDPKALADSNQIEFEFIGHYSDICENPVDSSLWLNISAQSVLVLDKQQLHIANDLSSFPTPFFNVTTNTASTLPIIFSDEPDANTLKAASIFASFGGVLTAWRGVDYPVLINQLPSNGHAVVFITNDKRPYFLKDYPKSDVPTVEMADIPGTQSNKLLIISAPTSEKLIEASKALALGNVLFNGPVTEILGYTEVEKRKPYDSPNWIDSSKKVYFGQLTTFDGQLSANGIEPAPINVQLNLPPDLYFVNGSRVDMNLIYKYTKPTETGMSQLRFILNNHLVRSYPLKPDSQQDKISENLPIMGAVNLFGTSKVDASFIRPTNSLTFDFDYSNIYTSKKDECTTQAPIPHRVEIDPASNIDFTGIYHFTQMPNLSLFWQSGYPFSIYADLQQTAAVIENTKDTEQLSTLLNSLGRIGAQLGYASTNIEILTKIDDKSEDVLEDKDILVIGNIPELLKDDDNVAIVLSKTEQAISTSFNSDNPNRFDPDKKNLNTTIRTRNSNGLGAIVSFQSPLNSDRTVVAMLSDSPEGLAHVNSNLVLNRSKFDARGTVTVMKSEEARSFDVGQTYYLGNLPWYQRIFYMLLDKPWLLMFLSIFCAVIFCLLAYKILKKIQVERILKLTKKKAQ
ncbi:MAG: cellulose biosynthesis cyclic di-GMP-binding regulatory protein BcsB [Succinivibrio sp.]|nr:cellulose biosynthesis cyclic di-GMP-binding regulatory protein BcsB [Succinivibrio sp.]